MPPIYLKYLASISFNIIRCFLNNTIVIASEAWQSLKMKYLRLPEGKSIWSSLIPITIALYLLFSMISISLSQIFLSFSLIIWIIMLIREKQKFTFPSFFWPLLVYIFLSLISALLSVNPRVSFKDSKELLLFLIVPIVYLGFTEIKILKKANIALLISGYASSLYVIFIYFFKTARPYYRATGFVGQKMTQAGLLILFCCIALSIFLFSKEKIRFLWGAAFLVSLFALILTQTRSSWIALVFCAALILLFYKPKTLIIIPLALVLFYFISPKWIKERTLSIFSLKRKSDQLRIEYLKVGIEIIKDFPIFGTGPDTVDIVYQDPKYALSDEARKNVHLHNNILQTAAERGIPTLLAWLTFIALVSITLFNLLKNKDPTNRSFTVAALAAVLGLFTAGLFEYNFADSEITALFLYIITIPFLLSRVQESKSNNQKTS